jgi:hypothetical protein
MSLSVAGDLVIFTDAAVFGVRPLVAHVAFVKLRSQSCGDEAGVADGLYTGP